MANVKKPTQPTGIGIASAGSTHGFGTDWIDSQGTRAIRLSGYVRKAADE